EEICIPESGSVSFTFNAGGAGQTDKIRAAQDRAPLPVGWPVTFAEENGTLLVTLTPDDTALFDGARDFALFPEEWGMVDNTATASVAAANGKIVIAQARGDRKLSEVPTTKAVLTYTDGH